MPYEEVLDLEYTQGAMYIPMQEYYLHESLPRVPDPNYKCLQGSQIVSQDMPRGLFPQRPKTHDTACLTNVFMEDIDILQSSNTPVIKTSPTKKQLDITR